MIQRDKFKETKELLTLAMNLQDEIYNITADRKVTIMEVFTSGLSLFRNGKNGIEGIQDVAKELDAATGNEINELKSWFASKFDIEDEKLEAVMELSLNAILDLVRSAYAIKQLTSKTRNVADGDMIAILNTISLW